MTYAAPLRSVCFTVFRQGTLYNAAMTLLILYISLALGVSFLCSVAEAVLLSVTTAYTHLLEQEGKHSGVLWRELKQDVDRPLSAILTLNTIAHTVGAAGAGAQAAVVFGSHMLGVFSAVLTFLILVFSEIIPKTLGAFYWRGLAPSIAYLLRWMVILLYPFVLMSNWLTSLIARREPLRGLSREEFSVMAELGGMEGELEDHESRLLRNVLLLREMRVKDVMTPRPVLFTLPEDLTVAEFFHEHEKEPFSRIPIYGANQDQVTGFVLRADLISAQGRGETQQALKHYRRELPALVAAIDLLRAFEVMLEQSTHMMLVVDEYGGVDGVITLEDIFETLLGMEIVDEKDRTKDMQRLARRLARRRSRAMGMSDTGEPPVIEE
jgi:CBS domain containing-hemolysin-like protein